MIAVGAVAAVLALALAFLIVRSIVKPLAEAVRVRDGSAKGDRAVRCRRGAHGHLDPARERGRGDFCPGDNEAQATIASAVDQQTVTTAEIGRTVAEAATGSGDIAQNISGVATSAKDTSTGATSTQQAAGELSRMASELSGLVSGYKF